MKFISRSEMRFFARIMTYLQPYRGRFFIALGAMIIYGATDGAVPFLIKTILDDIFGAKNEALLMLLPCIVVAFAVIRGFACFYQRYLISTVGHRIVRDLRDQLHQHLLQLSPAFFTQNTSGSLISRMTNDTLLIRSALTESAAAVLRDSVRVVVLLVAALYLDPWLGLVALVGLPLGLLPVIKVGLRVRRLSRIGQGQFGELTARLQETILGNRVIQAFCGQVREQSKFAQANSHLTRTFEKAEKYGALSAPINEFAASLAIAIIVFYGGVSVISGTRTQGDFLAFLTALFLLYEPVKKLARVNNSVQQGAAAAERIFEILDTKSELSDLPGAVELVVSKPSVTFDRVCFAYDSTQNKGVLSQGYDSSDDVTPDEGVDPRLWAVEDISLHIKEGEMLALVGMSGGGKSTLANLLLRYFDPQRGSVKIEGVDLRQATLNSVRQATAYVSQHTFLFNDTVAANIAYGRPGASLEEVKASAQAAYATDFIARLPQGFNTVIGEQGFSLSGGERARIAIARALLKDAPILILDEATAALDSQSESLVQQAIDRLMRGRTVLVIAHRLATIKTASRVAVIVHGRMVELGTHKELLELGGEYAKLYRLQFADSQSATIDLASEERKVVG